MNEYVIALPIDMSEEEKAQLCSRCATRQRMSDSDLCDHCDDMLAEAELDR